MTRNNPLDIYLYENGFEELYGLGLWAKDGGGLLVDTNSGNATIYPYIDATRDNILGFAESVDELLPFVQPEPATYTITSVKQAFELPREGNVRFHAMKQLALKLVADLDPDAFKEAMKCLQSAEDREYDDEDELPVNCEDLIAFPSVFHFVYKKERVLNPMLEATPLVLNYLENNDDK